MLFITVQETLKRPLTSYSIPAEETTLVALLK